MKTIRLEIPNTTDFIIGDIWVDVDIQLKPMIPYSQVPEQVSITHFNAELNVIAGELSVEIKKILSKKLERLSPPDPKKGEEEGK